MARLAEPEDVQIRIEEPSASESGTVSEEEAVLYECGKCKKTYKTKGGLKGHWKNKNTECKESDGMNELTESDVEECTIENISNPKVQKQIVDLILAEKKIDACLLYRQVTGKSMTDAVNILGRFWADEQMKHIDPSKFNKISCYNCAGCCGQLKQFLSDYGEKLYDMNRGHELGRCCSQFKEKDFFSKRFFEIHKREYKQDEKMIVSLDHNNGRNRAVVTLDKPMVRVAIGNKEEYRIFAKDKFQEEFNLLMLELFVEKQFKYRQTRNADSSLTLRRKGIEPTENETWEEYLSRITEEIRKIKEESTDKINKMSDKEVLDFIKDILSRNNVKAVIAKWGDDFQGFLEAFYPDRDFREIAKSLVKEEFRNDC